MIKLRPIAYHHKGKPIHGLTVPEEIATFFKGVYFNVFRSGTSILFNSGVSPFFTEKEIKEYKYEDCQIENSNIE